MTAEILRRIMYTMYRIKRNPSFLYPITKCKINWLCILLTSTGDSHGQVNSAHGYGVIFSRTLQSHAVTLWYVHILGTYSTNHIHTFSV